MNFCEIFRRGMPLYNKWSNRFAADPDDVDPGICVISVSLRNGSFVRIVLCCL